MIFRVTVLNPGDSFRLVWKTGLRNRRTKLCREGTVRSMMWLGHETGHNLSHHSRLTAILNKWQTFDAADMLATNPFEDSAK